MSRKKIISTVIAVLISLVFLYLAFKRIEFDKLIRSFGTINWLYSLPFLAITWLTMYLRTWRWKRLLQASHDLPVWELFGPLMVGFGFNSIFPARAGEFARPLALVKTSKVPFTTGFSSIVLERVWDVLAILGIFIACSFFIEFDEGFSRQWGDIVIKPETLKGLVNKMTIMAGVLLAGSVAMMSTRFRDQMLRFLRWVPYVPEVVRTKVIAIFETFAQGFNALRQPVLIAKVAFDTIVIWVLLGWSFQVMSWGFPGIEMSFLDAMVFLVITCILVALPSAPGYWGLYEIGGLIALILCDVTSDESLAMSFTLVVHFLQWILVTVIGLYYAARIHVSVKEVSEKVEEEV